MKQNEITPGHDYYVKLRPYDHPDSAEWTGIPTWGSEAICVVTRKGVELNGRKDRIEVNWQDNIYLVPARHIVESVKGREIRVAKQQYEDQWRQAIRDNERFDKINNVDKARLGEIFADNEERAGDYAARLRRELIDLKKATEKQIDTLDEVLENPTRYSGKLKDGAKYPTMTALGGGSAVLSAADDVASALRNYDRATALVNALIEAQKVEEEGEVIRYLKCPQLSLKVCYNTPMSKHKWNFDQTAINEAAEHLGLTFPVKVVGKRGKRGSTIGYYKGIHPWSGEWVHEISVDRHLSAQEVSQTIWHELTHAQQTERYLGDDACFMAYGRFVRDYEAAGGGNVNSRKGLKKYMANEFEVEANENEKLGNVMLLVTRNK